MQSKTSYFNKTLFLKNLSRFWPLWGGASLMGALAPLTMLVALLHQEGAFTGYDAPLQMTGIYYAVVCYAVPILSLLYAVLCAMAVWNYLFNARSVSLMHTLPITRKGLFLTNTLSGLAMMLIPYAVTGGLAILITLAFGLFDPLGVLVTVVSVAGMSLFYFASATLVAFITGNAFAMPALYFIFHFLAAALEYLVSSLMSRFYFGVTQAYSGVVEFLSPTMYFFNKLFPAMESNEVIRDGRSVWETTAVRLSNGWLIAVYAAVGLVLLGCAYLLYARRRSECAGDVVAVNWMKPIFRYGVALCSALALGMMFYGILWESFQSRGTVDLIPMALCMMAGGIIGFYIASMLLAKSLRVFRSTWKGAVCTLVAAAALCVAVGMDPAGVERWTPRADEVETVWVNLNNWHYGGGMGTLGSAIRDPETIAKILEAHQEIIAERDTLDSRTYFDTYRDDGLGRLDLRLEYTLKDGRYRTRDYSFNYPPEELRRQGSAVERLSRLVCDPKVQEANIFGGVPENSRLTGGYLNNMYDPETREMETVSLSTEELQTLESAIRRDIALGNFGRTVFMDEGADYDGTSCYFNIRLFYTMERAPSGGEAGSGPVDSAVSLSLSTCCTETLKALEGLETLKDGPWLMLTDREYYELEDLEKNVGSGYEDYYEDPYGVVYPDTHAVYPSDAYVYAQPAGMSEEVF